MGYVGGRIDEIFPLEPTRRAARKMAETGGKVFTDLVRDHTPIDTGHLRESWKKKVLFVDVSPTGHTRYHSGVETDVEYAPYVEHGTGIWGPKHAPYVIEPKKPGGTLHWVNALGEDVFAKKVLHPGSQGAHMVADSAGELEHLIPAIFEPEMIEWKLEYEAIIEKQKKP